MKGRGDQQPRLRHGGEGGGDVLREKGLAGPETAAAGQGHQEGRLEPVAVLHRHRADDGMRLLQQAQPFGFGAAVGKQFAPGLGVRLRLAGGPRGEQDGGHPFGGNAWHFWRVFRVHRSPLVVTLYCKLRRKIEPRQVEAVEVAVAQAEQARVVGLQPAQGFRRLRGGLQACLAAQQSGGEADGEAVAVLAQVEQPAACGRMGFEQCLQRGDVRKVLAGAARAIGQPGEGCVQPGVPEQRQAAHDGSASVVVCCRRMFSR